MTYTEEPDYDDYEYSDPLIQPLVAARRAGVRLSPRVLKGIFARLLELPVQDRSVHLTYTFARLMRSQLPQIPFESLRLVRQLYSTADSDWRLGAELIARRASLLCRRLGPRSEEAQEAVRLVEELVSEYVVRAPHTVSDFALTSICHELCPAFSLSLLDLLRTSSGRVDVHIARAAHLSEWADTLLVSWDEEAIDFALAENKSVSESTRIVLYARRQDRPDLACAIAARSTALVESILRANEPLRVRLLSKWLPRVPQPLRTEVATRALGLICADPTHRDALAAARIYSFLGAEAGLRLIASGNDEVARAVAMTWRWTLDDGIYDALRRHSKQYVRRKMVPSVFLGESTDFTAEEERRLRETVIPALLKDRSKVVQARARELLAEMDEPRTPTSEMESEFAYFEDAEPIRYDGYPSWRCRD